MEPSTSRRRALLRRPRPRALVARRALPVPADTYDVLDRLAREASPAAMNPGGARPGVTNPPCRRSGVR